MFNSYQLMSLRILVKKELKKNMSKTRKNYFKKLDKKLKILYWENL